MYTHYICSNLCLSLFNSAYISIRLFRCFSRRILLFSMAILFRLLSKKQRFKSTRISLMFCFICPFSA